MFLSTCATEHVSNKSYLTQQVGFALREDSELEKTTVSNKSYLTQQVGQGETLEGVPLTRQRFQQVLFNPTGRDLDTKRFTSSTEGVFPTSPI